VELDYQRYQPADGSLSMRIGSAQRRRLFELFMSSCRPSPDETLLDVGVTANRAYGMNNYLELLYPHKHRITAAGFDPESDLPGRYPGLTYVQVGPGPLPFADGSFDVVHSSAVIEHVGSRDQQREFLAELWRVSRRAVFVTTPNRWFPVEFHTLVPLLHWLPAPTFRASLRRLGRDFYADESTLNLLGRSDLRRLAAESGLRSVGIEGVRLLGWETNLALHASRAT
jgi:hypothetical protein